ncbi:MAG TPA: c-type cytochrome [Methylibium sp.]|nr:c-type cytochrome [Methylibium sp.]
MSHRTALCILIVGLLGASGSALANPELAQKKTCLACHAVDKKVIGPGFKEVAAKYAADKAAVDTLSKKVLKGGAGVWGNAAMPPMAAQVSEAEAKELVTWILGLK